MQHIFWSYEVIPWINLCIIEHEIKTSPNSKHVRQCLRAMSPHKEHAIKAEVENILKDGLIYPVYLTEWICNLVHAEKKEGTIYVCTNFRDLNRAYPKDNLPTPFID